MLTFPEPVRAIPGSRISVGVGKILGEAWALARPF